MVIQALRNLGGFVLILIKSWFGTKSMFHMLYFANNIKVRKVGPMLAIQVHLSFIHPKQKLIVWFCGQFLPIESHNTKWWVALLEVIQVSNWLQESNLWVIYGSHWFHLTRKRDTHMQSFPQTPYPSNIGSICVCVLDDWHVSLENSPTSLENTYK